MWQEEGGSAIEAFKIAGHATVSQTRDYTMMQLERHEELTCAIRETATAENPEKRTAQTAEPGSSVNIT